MGFSETFIWGAATSAYQIEGAHAEAGKGESIWDVYTREPGHIMENHNGNIACDHYHRMAEDVALMKEMGLQAYRFSLSWARLLPEGTGRVNEAGVQFYQELIDLLLENGITPYITLYHWDLPYALYQRGGWMNPESVEWFGNYAKLVAQRFSDRVVHYFTMNEPQCFIGLGFLTGVHAPGLKCPLQDIFAMAHNVLKAHGRGVQMLRQYGKQPLEIGYAPTCSAAYPETETPEDMKLIAEPIDVYAQNIYNGKCIRMGADGQPEIAERCPGFPRTANGWPITPESLYWGPKFLYERYGLPFYITENGISCHDVRSLDGKVHDPNRIDFLNRYLQQLNRAAGEIDLRGYFQWSLMDNFEWEKGYSERFGLVYVDYQTQERIRKDSAHWYRKVIQTNGSCLLSV